MLGCRSYHYWFMISFFCPFVLTHGTLHVVLLCPHRCTDLWTDSPPVPLRIQIESPVRSLRSYVLFVIWLSFLWVSSHVSLPLRCKLLQNYMIRTLHQEYLLYWDSQGDSSIHAASLTPPVKKASHHSLSLPSETRLFP